MLAQIIKQTSDNIAQSLAKHAPQSLSSPNLAQTPLKKGEQATFFTRFGNELAQNPQAQNAQKHTQSVFDFDFIARDKAPNPTPELPKNPNAELSQNPKTSTEEKHSFNPPPTAEGLSKIPPPTAEGARGWVDLARYKELESSLDSRFNNFDKQASDSAQDINKWFEAQRSAGNKEILEYDKDLAEYRKLDDAIRTEKQEKADKAYYKKATQEWLEKYKPAMIDKTDAEIIATQGKEAGKSYDEARHLLASMRKDIERNLDLRPIAEFGTNYAEFYQDGKGAIAKLIAEANAAKQAGQDFSGQVAGAFSKEIDGAPARIDLVWGEITNAQTHEGYGLAHIIDKHPELDLNLIPKIIEKGQIVENAGTKTIIYKTNSSELRVGLSKGFFGKGDNEWVITAYQKATPAQNFDQVASKVQSGNNLSTSGDNQIIQKISQKFNKDEKYAKNLYEWHKDSHPFTKEADGTPKVFYHSSRDIFETFDKNFDESKWGFWFSPLKEYIDDFRAMKRVKGADKVYKVFLKAKKIADLTDDNFFDEIIKQALKTTTKDKIAFYPYMTHSNEFKTFLKNQGYDGLIWNAQGKRPALVVFDSNQIKEVGNKGTFDATNPNIYHSSSTAGGGLAGGTIAGVERDDEGNAVGFSPEKFALGFAAGASGAKVLGKIANTKSTQNLATKTLQMLVKQARTNPRAKAVLEKIQVKSDIMPRQNAAKGQEMQKSSINFTTDKDQPISQIRNKAKSILNLLLNQKITNKNDGRVAMISAQGRDKILSSEACKKSVSNGFSKEEHFSASEHIKELYENSKYIKSEPARNNSADIKNYHRYIADLEVNKKPAQALLTLKELIKDGNRIYSLELQEIRPLLQAQAHTKQAQQGQS